MKTGAIERKKVSDEVFERTKEMIASGAWKPGDKLPSENELQSIFQVSRVSIREALKKLQNYNIIETQQGKGSFIRKFEDTNLFDSTTLSIHMNNIDEFTIRDMMEFRSIVETESVYLAAQRATELDIRYLKDNYQNMLNSKDDIHLFSDYDFQFHEYIAKITGNTILIKYYSAVFSYLKEYFDKVVEKIGVDKGSFYHGEILTAIENKNAELAKKLMSEHLSVAAEFFFKPSNNK